MSRLWVALLVLLLAPALVRAALDAELNKPYELTVVLHVADHRSLTPIFRDQVQRELRDHLQGALEGLAHVQVVREHPLLGEVEAKGLQQALDNWKAISASKTHFVLVDFVNGGYEIQARQQDGLTGLASPVVRRERIMERLLVARTAALMVAHDFGLVGTVAGRTEDPATVRLALKGGGLGLSLERWIKKEDVFAIAKMTQSSRPGSGGQESSRVEWALLQVREDPRDGICTCQLWNRYKDPLAQGDGVLGYRCLKLGTTEAPLRLRLVRNRKTGAPLSGCAVLVSAFGFQPKARDQAGLVTSSDGFVTTKERYRNLAFVRVELNTETPLAQIPIEIVADQTVVCFVPVDPTVEKRGQIDRDNGRWLSRLNDSLESQTTLFKDLNTLAEKERDRALERARSGLAGLKTDIRQRITERDSLQRTAQELGLANQFDVKAGQQRLQELEARRNALESFIKNLEEIFKQENNPKIQEWRAQVERANLLESQAEFGKALEIYERVLREGAELGPKLADRVKELKQAWEIRSPEHQEARTFIYETWPKQAKAAEMKATLEEARKHFDTCRKVGDDLSSRMLVKVTLSHATKLEKELGELASQTNEDARRTADTIDEVSGALQKLIDEVTALLSKAKPAAK